MALDPAGDLYIADQYNNRVQEVAAATGTQRGQSMTAGDIYTVAGSASGADGYSGDGGAATSALLNGPDAIAVDPAGDLYIADTANNRAQFVAAATCSSSCPSGLSSTTANDIYTVAGSASGASGSSGDGGAATSALLSGPAGVALDPAGDLYIADTNNNRAQFVAATTCSSSCPWGLSSTTAGHIYTIAGSAAGGSGESGQRGPATSALLEAPAEVALDPSGNLLVADTYNYEVQLVAASTCSSGCSWGPFVTTAAHVYTVAGSVLATGGHSGDAAPATSALLGEVGDVVADRFGNLYIADTSNNRVQEVAATTHTQWGIAMTAGDIYTVAGSASGTAGSSGDGGPATSALLSSPTGVALDAAGDLYIADQANNRAQEVAATTHTQWGIAMTAGDVYTVAGTGTAGYSGDGGAATSARIDLPTGVALDPGGDLYIADQDNNRVQEVAATTHTQWGRSMTAADIYTVAGSATGSTGHSGDGGAATSALLEEPNAVALDSSGDLYIADTDNNRVQFVAAGACSSACPFGLAATTAGDIYTIAGSASGSSGSSGDGGAATSALLSSPSGVALDPAGNLYIADAGNNRAQFVAAKACSSACPWGLSATTPGYVYTVAGSASGAEGHAGIGGLATSALLDAPAGVGLGSSGDLYVADTYNYEVAEVPAAVNPAAFTTGYTYNAYGDLTSTTDPDGDVTSATYDDLGNELSSTDARGYTTSYSYDADNELTGVSLPGSLTESYTYDGDGNRLTSVDARGKTTTYTYDPLGRVVSVEDPDGHTTSYSYDAAGNELSVTDPDGDVTSYAYDHDNRLETVTQANSTTLGYTYDPDGNEASYTNGAGGTTTYGYNDLDELTSVTDPLARATSYTYNPDGDQLTLTQPGAKVTTWTYNGDDQVAGASYSDGVTHPVSYTYTPDGQVATMADASGTSSYAYDDAGRLVAYQDGAGATVSYAYDPDGDVTALGYPNGYQVSQAYDALGRLSSVTDWLGGTTSFSYDADSDLTGASYPNGVSAADSYDNADLLSSITDTKGSSTLVSFSYTRDNAANLSAETDTGTPGAGGTSYGYNSLHQFTAAGSASYGYDNANDLTTGPGGITQAFDADGELCWSASASGSCSSPPSGATAYSYSAQGDRTARTPASGSSTSYSWDEADHLAQVATGSASTSFVYDGTGLRQSETAGSATTYFTWGTEGALPLLLSDGANSYIYGPAGTPVEQVSSSGTPTYLLADQLGSTRALTNASGSVTATFSYDAWGNLTGSTGSATTPFMYAGQYYDSATGLYYMQARYYDPASGQFLSLDPDVGLTRAPYNYAGDDPVNLTDPLGLNDCGKLSFVCDVGHVAAGIGRSANNDVVQPAYRDVVLPTGQFIETNFGTLAELGAGAFCVTLTAGWCAVVILAATAAKVTQDALEGASGGQIAVDAIVGVLGSSYAGVASAAVSGLEDDSVVGLNSLIDKIEQTGGSATGLKGLRAILKATGFAPYVVSAIADEIQNGTFGSFCGP